MGDVAEQPVGNAKALPTGALVKHTKDPKYYGNPTKLIISHTV